MDAARRTVAKLIALAERRIGRDEQQIKGELKRSLVLSLVFAPLLIGLASFSGRSAVTVGAASLLVLYLLLDQVLKRVRGSVKLVDWYLRDP